MAGEFVVVGEEGEEGKGSVVCTATPDYVYHREEERATNLGIDVSEPVLEVPGSE